MFKQSHAEANKKVCKICKLFTITAANFEEVLCSLGLVFTREFKN